MRKIGALVIGGVALLGAALVPSGPAAAGPPASGHPVRASIPEVLDTGTEPDTMIAYGEYADGGALVEVVDLGTGARTTVSDSRGASHQDAGGSGTAAESFTPADRCANDQEFAFLSGPNLYWHQSEAWTFNPDNAPGTVPNWRAEIQAAGDVWQNATNPCGLPDTVGWVSPTSWTDDATALVPKNNCSGNVADGKNTFGFRAFDNDNFVAYACLQTAAGPAGSQWVVEGDVGLNTLYNFCHGCAPGPGGYDVLATALHEWGHILGLGHNCTGMPWWGNPGSDPCDTGAEEAAVMVPEIRNAIVTLSAGDIAGAQTLYPREEGYQIEGVSLVNDEGGRLAPGHEYTVHVDLKNLGMRPWKVDDAGYALATINGAGSEFEGSDWLTASHPTRIDADRTNGPGNDTATIVRDEVARLTLTASMPLAREGQAPSLESMGLLRTSGTPTFFSGPPVSRAFDIGTYGTAFDDQFELPLVVQGVETLDVWVDMKNTGTAPWFVNETLSLAATDGPATPRCSPFAGSNWSGCAIASLVDENVTATTNRLAPSASPVLPGQVGRFKFRFGSPTPAAASGLYTETFESALENGRWVGTAASMNLVVL